MSTPICDFVRRYAGGGAVRLHMPGHKGCGPLGCEALDITEIDGADDLFHPEGIIARSEENAGAVFGAHTLYAAGGSTLCIQAMVQLLAVYARSRGQRPLLLAGRNAHKAFVNAAALLDVPVRWLCSAAGEAYYSGVVTPEQLERELARSREPVTAVYLTCPDYLGELPDVAALAAVCMMGLSGEIAHSRLLPGEGSGTYRSRMLDAAFCMEGAGLEQGAKYELQ